MRFQVPQFIDTEEVIFFGMTLKQFLIVAAAVLLIFISFPLLGIGAPFLIVAGILGGGGIYLARGTIEDLPVYLYLAHAFNFLTKNKQYQYSETSDADPLANYHART